MKKLIEFLKQTKKYNLKYIEKYYLSQEVKDELNKYNFTLHELCYRLTHNIDLSKVFKCSVCGKLIKFNGRGYNNTCSFSCGRVNSKNKSKQTCLEKYGVENVFQSEGVKKKIKETNQLKFGKESYVQTDEYKKRYQEYCRSNYGVDNLFQAKEIKDKIKQTNINKYGKSSYTQTDDYKRKTVETNLKRYNVTYKIQQHIKNRELLTESYIKSNFIKDGFFLIQECAEFFNLTFDALQKRYKKQFNILVPNKQYKLKAQLEVYNYIKSIYSGKVELNTRQIISPLELDIYIPDKKLAIEFDGLMFHSYGVSNESMFNNASDEDSKCHLRKTDACQEKGIQLLHIFENEWLTKKDIWKSVIKNKLGLIMNKIYARKCEIRQVQNSEKETFLNTNHLQGSCQSSINLGLYYNNELVSLMTFGKSRFNKEYKIELLRFCNKLNTVVVGGASKLLSYFRKHYNDKIISYANRRWSNGDLYQKLGFSLLREAVPNYYYFKEHDNILHNRLEFQKHHLKSKLESFNKSLSETQNMYNNGYRKIYDCGNYVYVSSQ